jgi:hypothetical protein
MKKFKEGETSTEDKPRSGRPSAATIGTNRQRVDQLIETLKKLREAIRRKRPNKNLKRFQIHHDNSAHLNTFKVDSRVGSNDGASALLVMETMWVVISRSF